MSILGVNAWLVTLVWPLGFRGELGAADIAAVAGPLALLGAGLFALGTQRHATATWILLCAFPAGLAAVLATRPDDWNRRAHDLPALAIEVLSLLAYAASAAVADVNAAPFLRSRSTPLGSEPWDLVPAPPRILRRALAGLACAGAFAIALVAPTLGGADAIERDWGNAAREGGVLTAVVGASVAVAVVTGFAGALRARRADAPRPGDARFRVASALLLAFLGAVTWFAIRR